MAKEIEILGEQIIYKHNQRIVKRWLRDKHPDLGQVIHGITGPETYQEIGSIRAMKAPDGKEIEILDEQIVSEKGSFVRIKRWLLGKHPALGQIMWGYTGWETYQEIDRIRPMKTFMVIECLQKIEPLFLSLLAISA